MKGTELLPKTSFRDIWHYAVAYLLLIVTIVVAFLALDIVRTGLLISVRMLGGWRRHVNAVDSLYWPFAWILWMVYLFWIENRYRTAVTLARIRRARAEQPPVVPLQPPDNALLRFFWRHDLDILVRRFLNYFAGPVVIYILGFLLKEWAFSLY